jgi:hypothetical protein
LIRRPWARSRATSVRNFAPACGRPDER